jgi:hypothetical protein
MPEQLYTIQGNHVSPTGLKLDVQTLLNCSSRIVRTVHADRYLREMDHIEFISQKSQVQNPQLLTRRRINITMGVPSPLTKDTQAEQELRNQDPDLMAEFSTKDTVDSSTATATHQQAKKNHAKYQYIPLTMGGNGRTHVPSNESKAVLDDEVSLEDLQKMTTFFYENAFQDATLDPFIRSHDDPHGDRFAKWIHQKLTGSTLWDEERDQRSRAPVSLAHGISHVVHDRSSAHAAAWYSPKRPDKDVGRHFQLDEARVWMRLHFWALRTFLLDKSPTFVDYYIRFIGHFVRVYEGAAPAFARESWRWSADPVNIQRYIESGRVMKDVLGLTIEDAEAQLPESEANDSFWPYHVDEDLQWVPPQ